MIIEHPCTTCGYSLEKGAKLVALADIIFGSLTIITCSTLLAFFEDMTKETNNCTTNATNEGVTVTAQATIEAVVTVTPGFSNDMDNENETLVALVNDTRENVEDVLVTVSTELPVPDTTTTTLTSSSAEGKMRRRKTCPDYTFEWIMLITVLVFAVIQVLTVKLLLFGVTQKNISALYIWLIIAGFSIPATGFLIKMYEMIVVFAFSEEIKGHKVSHLLEEFRKMPYYCNIQQQLYPRPNIGPKGKQWKSNNKSKKYNDHKVNTDSSSSLSVDEYTNRFARRQGSAAHFHNKSFLINQPGSVFSVVQFK